MPPSHASTGTPEKRPGGLPPAAARVKGPKMTSAAAP